MQSTVVTKLKKAGIEPFKVVDGVYLYKDIPFEQISFRQKSKREMTEKQKQAAEERMRKMWRDQEKATKVLEK